MLKQVFQTTPVPYYRRGEFWTDFFGADYHANMEPYIESIMRTGGVSGLFAHPAKNPKSPNSIFLCCVLEASYWPSYTMALFRYDSVTGQLIKRISLSAAASITTAQAVQRTRSGVLYFRDINGTLLIKFELGATALALFKEEPKIPDTFVLKDTYPIAHFEGLIAFGLGGYFAIDDLADVYLDGSYTVLSIFTLSTGKWKYSMVMPDNIVDIALEDESRAYILLSNRVLVLFDYIRGEILGASKVPTLNAVAAPYWNNSDVRMAWDVTFRRILVAETTNDAPDGASTTIVRGFRAVPVPTRMTYPIPLRVPRKGRIIPVLTQVVGDMNEGVGGHMVTAVAQGSGSVVGITMTDHIGRAITHIACEGSLDYVPSPYEYDWEATGSPDAVPPNVGQVELFCSTPIYQPDSIDIAVSGTTNGPVDPHTGDPDEPDLPRTAPNMMGTMQSVFNRKHWNLDEANEDAPDGRGQFTEDCVKAMHDKDARFGHIDKNPGQNQYHGHAVDAIDFKNDDGETGEVYDIVTGAGKLTWGFKGRSTGALDKWRFP